MQCSLRPRVRRERSARRLHASSLQLQPIHPGPRLPENWRTSKENGALPNVAIKDAPVRLFEAFDFMSAPEMWLRSRNPLLLSAFRVWLPPGTCDALKRWMLKKNEKSIAPVTPGLTSEATGPIRVVTAGDFTAVVLESKQPVLVEFWTSWSRPCQVLDSVLQELAGHWGGKVKVVKVNADYSLDLSLCYDIQSVPTLLFFVAGSPCFRIVGTATREALASKINLLVGKHQAAAS